MTRDACLVSIGEIAVGWADAEECVRKLLWLYIGTDRPTFEIVISGLRANDLERMLRELVADKESNTLLRTDILTALQWIAVLRENRNKVLHRPHSGTVGTEDWPLTTIREIGAQISACLPILTELCDRALRFVMSRDIVETPIGDESFPGVENLPDYHPLVWPQKPRKIDPWGKS